MRPHLALSILLSLASPTLAQPAAPADPRVEWLRKNAVQIRSISPDDRDFSDLQPLKKILGDARVVLLGEPSHGDGSVFLAKTRLIQFLHEEMGFDVLAFESGLYDCRRAWEALQGGEDPVTAVRRGVFGIWTRSEQVIPLMEYLGRRARTPRPLELAGFDSQFTGSACHDFLLSDLAAYLRRIGSPTPEAPDWQPFSKTLQSMTEPMEQPAPPPAEQERFRARLRDLRQEIEKRAVSRRDREALFWIQMMESIEANASTMWAPEDAGRQARDEQMGRNLVWLANERYSGKKIIVWAATFHNARNLRRLDPGLGNLDLKKIYETFAPMGEVAHGTLGKQMYSLGFTAATGKAGSVFRTPMDLSKPTPGSLEDLMERAGLVNALVDFRDPPHGGQWLREPLITRPLGYTEMKGNWSEVLDGMMFIREMTPSTRAAR